MYQVGFSRQTLSFRERGFGMMGYGMFDNTVEGLATNLYVRTYCFKDAQDNHLVYSNAEICFITTGVRQGVLKKLAEEHPHLPITESNLILTAQHTHSGPGGYSHYVFYNVTTPGYRPGIYRTIVDTLVTSIVDAFEHMQPAQLYYSQGVFEPHLEVGFNRSLNAYNSNPEITEPLADTQTHLAMNREMDLLRIETPDGEPLGMLNWFGVHATSVGPKNTLLCADNKGYAAHYFEQKVQQKHQLKRFAAIFAQGSAGDISPNFYGKGKNWPKGKFDDDFESARFNGRLQFQKAWEIFEHAGTALSGPIDHAIRYGDYSQIECDPEFTGSGKSEKTGPSAHGVAFFKGTAVDGKGVAEPVGKLLSVVAKKIKSAELKQASKLSPEQRQALEHKYATQGPKDILIEGGERRFFGQEHIKDLPIPDFIEPVIAELKRLDRIGAVKEHTWTPHVLPVQIGLLGELAIVAVPGEITTVASRRLKKTIQRYLPRVKHVVINTYANAYHGYITTQEEYLNQNYEGGHTVFGQWTLAAFQTEFKGLCQSFDTPLKERTLPELLPPVFSQSELEKRTVL